MNVRFRNIPKVVYWNNIPAPYMVERFNALAERGNIDFEAWFNDRTEGDRSWMVEEQSWRFSYRYVPTINVGGKHLHIPYPLFLRQMPEVLVSLYAEPSYLVGWVAAKMRGVRTAFWCQVTMDSWVRRRRWKEWLKSAVFPRVDALLGSGEDSRQFAMRYGVNADQAICLPHSIDVDHYRNGAQAALPSRREIRSELGLRGTTFIYVGRLWWGKGLECLLESFELVQKKCRNEVSLLIVGDGELESQLRNRCVERDIKNVVFTGFQQKPDVPRYYAAADVFVFPTLGDPYGLVVDEAMASALPVISTTAAGEIKERIEEGKNGFLVPPGDSAALASAMEKFCSDQVDCAEFGEMSAGKIRGHTPEWWAENFEAIVFDLLSSQKAMGRKSK